MITKSDWDSVHDELELEARARLGPPPSAEEVEAYFENRLGPDDTERVRQLLVAYPQLAIVAITSEPDAPRPGDFDYVSPEEVARRRDALLAQLSPRVEKVATFTPRDHRVSSMWRAATFALAATLVLAVGGLILRMRATAPSVRVPSIASEYELFLPDTSRGGTVEPRTVAVSGDDVFGVKLAVIQPRRYDNYRLELAEANGGPVVWKSPATTPDEHYTIDLTIPRAFVKPGATYRITLFGVDAGHETLVDHYSFVIPRR